MSDIKNKELIEKAASVIRSRKHGDYTIGDVGCALASGNNNVYLGVCIDTSSSMGFCAEHNAIGSMITAGESKIKKIVAVWKDEKDTYIVSPCGRCREFMRQVDEKNLEADVILGKDDIMKLKELLPHYNKSQKISLQ
jgi:cytidine deaminase